MPTIRLGYGKTSIALDYDGQFRVLASREEIGSALSDLEIGAALDHPIASPAFEDLFASGDSVLIVVSDATRATGSAQIVNVLVRRLIQNGIEPDKIAIIFATGIHRAVRSDEKIQLLTPFIAQRVRTIDHDAYDSTNLVRLGVMSNGEPIEINRAVTESSKVIVTGAIGFHYFAGFTGGRKSICPGLASARTIEATHMLALDFERGGRRQGVGTGLLEGNAVSEACEHVTEMVAPIFSVNTIVDPHGRPVKLFPGHWREAHHQACRQYLVDHSLAISEKRDLVVVSCGGSPYDINMIQAHKALDMAAQACRDGGTIVLLAECADGLGREDFLKWFAEPDSVQLENRLRKQYEVNGQTAWTLFTKTERFEVKIVTSLKDDDVRSMRMTPARSIEDALKDSKSSQGFIMPRGAALLPTIGKTHS